MEQALMNQTLQVQNEKRKLESELEDVQVVMMKMMIMTVTMTMMMAMTMTMMMMVVVALMTFSAWRYCGKEDENDLNLSHSVNVGNRKRRHVPWSQKQFSSGEKSSDL